MIRVALFSGHIQMYYKGFDILVGRGWNKSEVKSPSTGLNISHVSLAVPRLCFYTSPLIFLCKS